MVLRYYYLRRDRAHKVNLISDVFSSALYFFFFFFRFRVSSSKAALRSYKTVFFFFFSNHSNWSMKRWFFSVPTWVLCEIRPSTARWRLPERNSRRCENRLRTGEKQINKIQKDRRKINPCTRSRLTVRLYRSVFPYFKSSRSKCSA